MSTWSEEVREFEPMATVYTQFLSYCSAVWDLRASGALDYATPAVVRCLVFFFLYSLAYFFGHV